MIRDIAVMGGREGRNALSTRSRYFERRRRRSPPKLVTHPRVGDVLGL
jgi:hypothetical protein